MLGSTPAEALFVATKLPRAMHRRCHRPHICMPCMATVVPDASWNVVNAEPAAQHGRRRTARCIH